LIYLNSNAGLIRVIWYVMCAKRNPLDVGYSRRKIVIIWPVSATLVWRFIDHCTDLNWLINYQVFVPEKNAMVQLC